LARTLTPAPVIFLPPNKCELAPASVLPPLEYNESIFDKTSTTEDTPVSPFSAPLLPQLLPVIVDDPCDVDDEVKADVDGACGGGHTQVPGHVPELGLTGNHNFMMMIMMTMITSCFFLLYLYLP
jgi:hypothetical protein